MSFRKKKRPYTRDKLASITVRVTRDHKKQLSAKGNMSRYIRELLDECFTPYPPYD